MVRLKKRQRLSDVLLDEVHLLVAPNGDEHSSELTSLCLGVVDQHRVDDVDAISRRPLVRGCLDDREEVLGLVRGNLRRFTNSPGRHWCQWNLLGESIAGSDLLTGGFLKVQPKCFRRAYRSGRCPSVKA